MEALASTVFLRHPICIQFNLFMNVYSQACKENWPTMHEMTTDVLNFR